MILLFLFIIIKYKFNHASSESKTELLEHFLLSVVLGITKIDPSRWNLWTDLQLQLRLHALLLLLLTDSICIISLNVSNFHIRFVLK